MAAEKGTLGFIGAGNMATALVSGLITSGLYRPEQLMASDCSPEKLEALAKSFGLKVRASNRELVGGCGAVVLAVKPQILMGVLEEIKEEVRAEQLLISIAAGIPLGRIQAVLGADRPLIRVMPNTPALIQKGISALAPGARATPAQMGLAGRIFAAVGETVIVEEAMMDAVTALSGSGPGYVFRLMECFAEAGKEVGFDEETALRLVKQTFLGAAHLAAQSPETLARLREMVTSPGGTTAAGLAVLDQKGLHGIIQEAVKAACARSVALGKGV